MRNKKLMSLALRLVIEEKKDIDHLISRLFSGFLYFGTTARTKDERFYYISGKCTVHTLENLTRP
ncbi:hypothetical protein J2W98_000196 [Paenibacillus peoriae]|jgi:hypothetical protein|uniref:Uncharacterized protein n=1 Tax=Paenibacillus peoriae TaxID=59893 RepID=A0ABU1Q8K3_9BACL|nr:hypothetical protein [Paenibacillus peoriae]